MQAKVLRTPTPGRLSEKPRAGPRQSPSGTWRDQEARDRALGRFISIAAAGFALPSLNIAAVRNARPDEQGLASGMFIAAVQIGSGIVLAVVASVFTSNAGSGLRAYHAGLWTVFGIAAGATLLAASGLLVREHAPAAALVAAERTV